ncbi:response regulator [Tamlana sp. 62-3]|uniref:histidine kinase n=1 Tax=Neotamlana sargassicola TaxID=2883125 RepID=A0A9X1L5R5_9FLAO|nr:response regulator [Tamlana sargassicola]MCB4806991.1 response regulator [Tamlana sargassicola]
MAFNFYKSYRFKIVFSFLIVIAVTLLLFVSYNYFNSKTLELQKLSNSIYELESDFSNNEKYFLSFLLNGYKSPEFYNNYKEKNIDAFINKITQQKDSLINISRKLNANKLLTNSDLVDSLKTKFGHLYKLSEHIKHERFLLGYHDYGKIGHMRKLIHGIEASRNLPVDKILQLRRHEKDFLLRSDSLYINQFNSLASKLIEENPKLVSLKNYKNLFNDVSKLYFNIGYNSNKSHGLCANILATNKNILSDLNEINTISKAEIAKKNAGTSIFIKSSISAILLFMVLLILYLSQILTRDLKRLKVSMHKFIKSDFKEYDFNVDENSKILEIDFLYKAYDLLKENLLKNIDGLNLTIEELERATAYKSSFLANMSHEIRTPLNGIIGVLNLINQTNLNENQVKLLEIANHSSSHLLGLINLILDYSKISAGKMELEYIPLQVEEDLSKIIKIFDFQAQEKNIDLLFEYNKDKNASDFVFGDTIRLNQIIINLLNNALKFTETGYVKLKVTQKQLNANTDTFLFSVKDTGIGMEKSMSDKIFQAFEQEDLSTTRKFGGTGLGLAISNELASLMNAELKFESEKGVGTEFYFELQLKRTSQDSSLIPKNNFISNLNSKGETIKVLVVDDNKMNQKVLALMLKKFNIEINYADNGVEAIEAFKNGAFHMVFMDIQMPIMDGLEATKNIKQTEIFKANPIPIIAVSASAYTDDRRQASQAGIDDFISKPIELKNLQDILIKYSLKV